MGYVNRRTWLVLYRDSFMCQECGRKFRPELFNLGTFIDLEVHHINGDRQDNRFENLISLCNSCHLYKAHNGSWKNKPVIHYHPKTMSEALIQGGLEAFSNLEIAAWNYMRRYAVDLIKQGKG